MTSIIVSDPATFCFRSVDDDFRMSPWYWSLIGGIIGVCFVYIAVLWCIDANVLHFRVRSLFVMAAQLAAWAAVMAALGVNFKTRIDSDGGDQSADPYLIPFCGLEQFPQCTEMAQKATGLYFQVFIGASFALTAVTTLMAVGLLSFLHVTAPVPDRPLVAGGCSCSWDLLFSVAKWMVMKTLQHAPILSLFVFSPGLMMLQVIPYGSRCFQDRNPSIAYNNAIIHGAFFVLVVVTFVVEVIVTRLIVKATSDLTTTTLKATWISIVMFCVAGVVMFFVHFIASARNGAYVSNIVFGAFYPILIVVVLRIVSMFEAIWVHAFSYSNTTSFQKRKPSWSLEARLQCCRAVYSNVNLSDALHRLGGCLDRFYGQLDTQEIEALARNEYTARLARSSSQSNTSSGCVNRMAKDHHDENGSSSLEEDSMISIIALTTLVGPRPGRLIDKFFYRIQLFDRLQTVLESAMGGDEDDWISHYEPKLAPLLILMSIQFQKLPLVKENPFDSEGSEPSTGAGDATRSNYKHCTFIDVRRFNRTSEIRRWFLQQKLPGAPKSDDDGCQPAIVVVPGEPTSGADASPRPPNLPVARNPMAVSSSPHHPADEDEYNYYHNRDDNDDGDSSSPAERWAIATAENTSPTVVPPSSSLSPLPPPAATASVISGPASHEVASDIVGLQQREAPSRSAAGSSAHERGAPPVVFRTLLMGFTQHSALKDVAGKNDAILIIQHHLQIDIPQNTTTTTSGGGGMSSNETSLPFPLLGPWRYVGDVVSQSWRDQRECDMIYFPGALFYVRDVSSATAPTKVWLAPAIGTVEKET